MVRLAVPPTADPMQHAWRLAGAIGAAIQASKAVVAREADFTFREFEAARMRIAQINRCDRCQAFRADGRSHPALRGELPPSDYFEQVRSWRTAADLSTRERLAAEFAERFAEEHLSLDDDEALWAALHSAFTDDELVQLALIVTSVLGTGRFNHVFGIDGACEI